MKTVCVFCGSNSGVRPAYVNAARSLGTLLATRGLTVVYGGGRVGLMGALADGALEAGGTVIGVMPHALVEREVAHRALTRLEIVDGMHERKARLAELTDAFMALPGGIGTLEEFFETWTWSQLGVHAKPLGLLDVDGYWRTLIAFFDHMGAEGFLRPHTRELLLIDDSAAGLLDQMAAFQAPKVTPWIRLSQT